MKLEEFEKLDKARAPGRWEAEIDCVDVGWVAIGPAHPVGGDAGPNEARADAAFIAACSDMVPRMIKALNYMKHIRDTGREKGVGFCAAVAGMALAELEQL